MFPIKDPSEVLILIKEKIKPKWKLAFFTAIIMGLLTHMVIFMNDIPNHDGLASMYFDQNMITSGRWFLSIACGITSYFTLPWLIGLLVLIYLGLTAIILVELLELKNNYSVVLVSGLLVTFPTLASTFAYIFTADGYMMGLFLATLAVLVTKKYKKGFILGGVVLAFSMGIYQAYLSFTMLLCFYQGLMICLSNEKRLNKIRNILHYLYMGIIGGTLYYTILQALLWIQGKELSNYQGINGIEGEMISSTESIWSQIYYDFFAFFLKGNIIFNNVFSLAAVIAIIFSILMLLVMVITKKHLWKTPYLYIIAISAIAILPIICNSILLISPGVYYHLLMRFHYILLIILGISFIDNYGSYLKGYLIQWVILISAMVMIVNYMVMDNISYSNMEKKFDKTYAYCLRLVDRMEQTEGYYQGIPVAMIGVVDIEQYPTTDLSLPVTGSITGTSGDLLVYTGVNYQSFLSNYLNVTIENVSHKDMNEIYNSEEYQKLEPFPAKNSMKVVEGILYIKTEPVEGK